MPALLRAAGLRLTTLAEHYGIPADEHVADTACSGWRCSMPVRRERSLRASVRNSIYTCTVSSGWRSPQASQARSAVVKPRRGPGAQGIGVRAGSRAAAAPALRASGSCT
jgi:hypothetical protein